MKSQSTSASPSIDTVPRSVVQVPMVDGEPAGFVEVSVSASAALEVSEEEEDKDEDTELGNSDDEDMDDINNAALPKETVLPNSPTMRTQTEDIWKQETSLTYGIRKTPVLSIRGINTVVEKPIIKYFRYFPTV